MQCWNGLRSKRQPLLALWWLLWCCLGLLQQVQAATCGSVFPSTPFPNSTSSSKLDLSGIAWVSNPKLPNNPSLGYGDYYYGGKSFGNGWKLTANGGASTRLFVDGSMSLGNNAKLNQNGNPEDLVIIVNGSLSIGNGANIRAIIYATGSISIGNNLNFSGALTAEGGITYGNTAPSYNATAVVNANLSGLCSNIMVVNPLAFDDFSTYPAISIDGANGGSGWGGAWSGVSGVQSVTDLSSLPMQYLAANGQSIVADRGLQFSGNNDYAAVRDLPGLVRANKVYLSMLLRYQGTQNNNDFMGLWLGNAAFGSSPQFGIKMNHGDGSGAEDLFIRLDQNGPFAEDLVQDRTYLVVAEFSKNGNPYYDQGRLWINPDCSASAPATATITVTNPSNQLSEFSRIGVRTANLGSDDRISIGQVAVGEQWSDVVQCKCHQNGLIGRYFNNYTNASASFPSGSGDLLRLDPQVNFSWGSGSPDPTINNDYFAVSWEGEVEATVTGSYLFSTVTDDGVRLWVNGVQLIDHWSPQSPTRRTASTTLNLVAGQRYPIRMEMYEQAGGATAQLEWTPPAQSRQIIPSSQLFGCLAASGPEISSVSMPCGVSNQVLVSYATGVDKQALNAVSSVATANYQLTDSSNNPVPITAATLDASTSQVTLTTGASLVPGAGYQLQVSGVTDQDDRPLTPDPSVATFVASGGNGLAASYYNNRYLSGAPTYSQIDPQVDFDWSTGSPAGNRVGPDQFSALWSGYVEAPETGNYRFWTESDDGVRLYVDNLSSPVIDNWSDHARTWNSSGLISLQAGQRYPIQMQWYENGGYAVARLHWQTPSNSTRQAIPTAQLFTCPFAATPQLDHIEIIHDGAAITCAPETLTLHACASADCATLYTDPVDVTLSPTGWVGGDTQTISNGSASLALSHGSPGSVSLGVSSALVTPTNPAQCIKNGVAGDCNLQFSDSGFIFSIPNQQSCQDSASITLSAVKKADNGVSCAPAFSGSRSLSFSTQYLSPTAGTRNISVNGMANPASNPLTLNFDSNAQTQILVNYRDAGQVSLLAHYSGSAATGDAGLSMDGSASFVATPDHLRLRAQTLAGSDLNAMSATTGPLQAAGKPFNFSVQAECSDNSLTPNYQPTGNTLQTYVLRTGPTTQGGEGQLSLASSQSQTSSTAASPTWSQANIPAAGFAGGIYTYAGATYSEVGLLRLYLRDSDYFGNQINAPALDIGRFVPDHFALTVTDPGTLAASCSKSSAFSYIGQDLGYQVAPVLKIVPQQADGSALQNYQGAYMRMTAADLQRQFPSVAANAGVDGSPLTLQSVPLDGSLLANGDGSLTYDYSMLDRLRFDKVANAKVTPFTADVTFGISSLQDADGVLGSGLPLTFKPGGQQMRYGRLVMSNAYGPETQSLRVPLSLEYFDGSSFALNTADSCTLYDATKLTPTGVATTASGSGQFAAGIASGNGIQLSAPGLGHSGTANLIYSVDDWLKDDWNDSGSLQNPSATATFGQYRGNDRVIYWREVAP